jgi:hypothetical protein
MSSHDHHHDDHHDGQTHGWRDPHAAPGPASVLDIGGDIGAIIVRLPGDTASGELTACTRGNPAAHFHTGVHYRNSGGEQGWVAVFPDVKSGEYSLLTEGGQEHTPFVVVGGQVTALDVTQVPDLTRVMVSPNAEHR